ncbi:MAG: PIN domain-containing protein [Rudaea sp.]
MLDTHVAVHLFEGRSTGLSAQALRLIDRDSVSISPAVMLELELLHEIRRLRIGAAAIVRYLDEHLAIRVAGERFADVARQALAFAFTRDPFDRLIAAHAAVLKVPLITFDEDLQRHYPRAMN